MTSGESGRLVRGVPERTEWRKSSASKDGSCVEVSFSPDRALVRDSRNPAGGPLRFPAHAWRAFLGDVRR
ncbi:DUF397 domain-containing protein [Saccharothrix sp. Mg75]|uniref:DUF397 domain-containing protein n=1 Tax=Saccharothrix sp. Mg75 TaxID=3445357 RepID=UPI003EECA225